LSDGEILVVATLDMVAWLKAGAYASVTDEDLAGFS
jgi:hypothetical protein